MFVYSVARRSAESTNAACRDRYGGSESGCGAESDTAEYNSDGKPDAISTVANAEPDSDADSRTRAESNANSDA